MHSLDEATRGLFDAAEDELSLFYWIHWLDSARMAEWEAIGRLRDKLVALHRKTGIRSYFEKAWKSGGLTNDAFIALSEFESTALMDDFALRSAFDDIYPSETEPLFRDQVEDELKHRWEFPTRQASDLVLRFEGRRTHAVESIVVFVGPLVGVVVGAVLTLLISG